MEGDWMGNPTTSLNLKSKQTQHIMLGDMWQ